MKMPALYRLWLAGEIPPGSRLPQPGGRDPVSPLKVYKGHSFIPLYFVIMTPLYLGISRGKLYRDINVMSPDGGAARSRPSLVHHVLIPSRNYNLYTVEFI